MNFTEKISRIFEKVDALMPLQPINLVNLLHLIGQWSHQYRKPIEVKNHGYKANSPSWTRVLAWCTQKNDIRTRYVHPSH